MVDVFCLGGWVVFVEFVDLNVVLLLVILMTNALVFYVFFYCGFKCCAYNEKHQTGVAIHKCLSLSLYKSFILDYSQCHNKPGIDRSCSIYT